MSLLLKSGFTRASTAFCTNAGRSFWPNQKAFVDVASVTKEVWRYASTNKAALSSVATTRKQTLPNAYALRGTTSPEERTIVKLSKPYSKTFGKQYPVRPLNATHGKSITVLGLTAAKFRQPCRPLNFVGQLNAGGRLPAPQALIITQAGRRAFSDDVNRQAKPRDDKPDTDETDADTMLHVLHNAILAIVLLLFYACICAIFWLLDMMTALSGPKQRNVQARRSIADGRTEASVNDQVPVGTTFETRAEALTVSNAEIEKDAFACKQTVGVEIEVLFVRLLHPDVHPAIQLLVFKLAAFFASLRSYEQAAQLAQISWTNDRAREVQETIREHLRQPCTARCSECGDEFQHNLSVGNEPSSRDPYDKWTVGVDTSLYISDLTLAVLRSWGWIEVIPVEIRSRKLLYEKDDSKTIRSTNGQCTHSISDMDENTAVTQRLQDLSGPASSTNGRDWMILTNRSCGLHVHIGASNKRLSSLVKAQNVAAVAVSYEPLLDRLHESHRIDGGNHPAIGIPLGLCAGEVYNKSLRQGPMQLCRWANDATAGFVNALSPFTRDDSLQHMSAIYSPSSLHDLEQLCGGRHRVVNFENLIPESEEERQLETMSALRPYASSDIIHPGLVLPLEIRKGTTEFRQHAGTLDPNRIAHWVHLCAAIDRYASTHSERDVLRLSLTQPDRHPTATTSSDMRAFLTSIGCPADTVAYYAASLHARPRRNSICEGQWNLLHGIADRNAFENAWTARPENVRAQIRAKALNGGYGTLPDQTSAKRDVIGASMVEEARR